MERVGVRSLIWYPVVLVAGLAGTLVGYLCTVLLYGVAAWVLRRPPVAPGTEAPRDARNAALLLLLALLLLVAGVVIHGISDPVV